MQAGSFVRGQASRANPETGSMGAHLSRASSLLGGQIYGAWNGGVGEGHAERTAPEQDPLGPWLTLPPAGWLLAGWDASFLSGYQAVILGVQAPSVGAPPLVSSWEGVLSAAAKERQERPTRSSSPPPAGWSANLGW